ncbi:hypothetical protein AALP_AA4G099000 [Arabis alpina]|uniref:Strictosidine synthase conserved region domain-containing protein n=1 Tax=Arabis alpina TaxID=50452 RepID=A0A087H2A8_ARAAL|nr:hypothetical protein AALP_AA4G099000 [Arabis alpina]
MFFPFSQKIRFDSIQAVIDLSRLSCSVKVKSLLDDAKSGTPTNVSFKSCASINVCCLAWNFLQLVFSRDNSGRVLKYDPIAKKAVILVSNVQFPNGVSISKDDSFFCYAMEMLEDE